MILGEVRLSVVRDSGGAYVNGQYQPSYGTPFPVWASVQPVTPETVQMLPEAARTRAKLLAYAGSEQPRIRTTDLDSGASADRVTYRNTDFLAIEVADWTGHVAGIPHMVYGLVPIGADE